MGARKNHPEALAPDQAARERLPKPKRLLGKRRNHSSWHMVWYRVVLANSKVTGWPSDEYQVDIKDGMLYVVERASHAVVLILNRDGWSSVDTSIEVIGAPDRMETVFEVKWEEIPN